MLLAGALTVSFAAQAAVVQDNTRSENPIEETDKVTDANLFGHVVDTKTGEHLLRHHPTQRYHHWYHHRPYRPLFSEEPARGHFHDGRQVLRL